MFSLIVFSPSLTWVVCIVGSLCTHVIISIIKQHCAMFFGPPNPFGSLHKLCELGKLKLKTLLWPKRNDKVDTFNEYRQMASHTIIISSLLPFFLSFSASLSLSLLLVHSTQLKPTALSTNANEAKFELFQWRKKLTRERAATRLDLL